MNLPEGWGWRWVPHNYEWQPQGRCIGWLNGDNLYLDPEAAYATVQALAREQNDPIPVTAQTLWKRLHERGLLMTTDQTRQTNTVRHFLGGQRRSVLHLHAHTLQLEDSP